MLAFNKTEAQTCPEMVVGAKQPFSQHFSLVSEPYLIFVIVLKPSIGIVGPQTYFVMTGVTSASQSFHSVYSPSSPGKSGISIVLQPAQSLRFTERILISDAEESVRSTCSFDNGIPRTGSAPRYPLLKQSN